MNTILEKITTPLIKRTLRSIKIFIQELSYFSQHPFYYFREYLNISVSILKAIILKSSNNGKITRKINGVNFIFDFKLDPEILNMFLGFYQIDVKNALQVYLHKRSTFIDIGANIGYISAIGAGFVGKKGVVHSFEPVPTFYKKLAQMARINEGYNIIPNNIALGEKPGKASINVTNLPNIGWNTMVPGMMRQHTIKKSIEVEVKRIDDYIIKNKVKNISLIKIDVEGFEYLVLKGLTTFFKQNERNLPPIIVEIAYSAYPKLGIKLDDLENLMKIYSYEAYTLDGKKKVNIKKFTQTTDVLFKPK